MLATRNGSCPFRPGFDSPWGQSKKWVAGGQWDHVTIENRYMLAKPGVTAPIIGTTSLTNLEDLLGALDVKLTDEEIAYLEEEYRPLPVSGHS